MTSSRETKLQLPASFSKYTFPSPGIPGVRDEIVVITKGDGPGPGVILLHEAGGMSSHCMDLADELAASGFRMFLPLLFGKPGQGKRVDVRGLFCMRKEMHFLASNRTSPIAGLLRLLIRDVATRTNGERVGVIGMCLTGNLVFALMTESAVGAAVASQPSLPFPFLGRWMPAYKKAALGTDPADVMEAVRSETPLLALRFEGDWLCPPEKFETLLRTFGDDGALTCEVVNTKEKGKSHSVLTADKEDADRDRVPLVRDFLIRHLLGSDPGADAIDPTAS